MYNSHPALSEPCSQSFYFQVQARFVERQSHEEFEKLHSFLQAEEEARMQALKREEEQRTQAMAQKIEGITRDIASVSESISALEEELGLEGISVLHVSLSMFDQMDGYLHKNTSF